MRHFIFNARDFEVLSGDTFEKKSIAGQQLSQQGCTKAGNHTILLSAFGNKSLISESWSSSLVSQSYYRHLQCNY